MFRDELERTCRLLPQNNEATRFVLIQTICSPWLDRQCWRTNRITGVYKLHVMILRLWLSFFNVTFVKTRKWKINFNSKLIWGAFHGIKSLNFRKYYNDKWYSFPRNFWKSLQLCKVYRKFRKFLNRNFRSIWLSSRNFLDFRLDGSLFVKIQQFPDFLEPVISVPFAPVSKFSEFLVEWKASLGCWQSTHFLVKLCSVENTMNIVTILSYRFGTPTRLFWVS